jgi:RecJ-like exonuclease
MTELSIKIEDIKTIKLSKNEHLVFNLSEGTSLEDLKAFQKAVKKAFPKLKDRVVFLTGNIKLTKVAVQ